MNRIAVWVHTPAAQAVAWALIHFLWEGAVLAAALAAILFVGRPQKAGVRYAAACAALFAMPVAFALTLWVLLSRIPGAPAAVARVTSPVPYLSAVPVLPPVPPAALTFRDLLPWLAPCWFVGVVFFYARALAGWSAARRLRQRGVCAPPSVWTERLLHLRARLSVSRPVRLLESCFTDTPVLVGYLRPVILMPLGCLANLPAAQIECILLHELAHVCRHDYLVNLLQGCVEGLFFYHPAMWWVSRVVREERENCCDDFVVSATGDARAYAATLAALERHRAQPLQPSLAATGGPLMKRIRRLLAPPSSAQPNSAPALAAGLLLIASAAVLAAWPVKAPAHRPVPPVAMHALALRDQPLEPVLLSEMIALSRTPVPLRFVTAAAAALERADSQPPAAQAMTSPERQAKEKALRKEMATPCQKWLNEDVAYIITAEERAAFLRLTTDDEREQFIEQFWKRRDPTPDTQENEFREEHYRRIAYANEHFKSGIPGWKTDRGRIYITYGPPDEIEDHSSGGSYKQASGVTITYPFQQWRYRYIQGIGQNVIIEFVDKDKSGEFHMTTDPTEKEIRHDQNPDPNADRQAQVEAQLKAVLAQEAALAQHEAELTAARAQYEAERQAVAQVETQRAALESNQAADEQVAVARANAQRLEDELRSVQQHLDQLHKLYTNDHPDVQATQAQMAALERQLLVARAEMAVSSWKKRGAQVQIPSVRKPTVFRSEQDPRVQIATHAQPAPAEGLSGQPSALIITLDGEKGPLSITAEITTAAGQPVQTVATKESAAPPGPFFRWLALPPGSYILRATISGPNNTVRSSQTPFTVE